VVASKGRFDRARSAKRRAVEGLPHESTLLTDDFMASTLDVWSIPPESARRVGHPAPFPVELPEQLIRLYTFRDDLVLDPFMGSGSALVAAARLGRRYIGYDLDAGYVDIARRRVADALAAGRSDTHAADGKTAATLAEDAIVGAGFRVTGRKRRIRGTGVTVDLVAIDGGGLSWFFLVCGAHTSRRGGLMRTEEVWQSLGRAAALRGRFPDTPVVLLAAGVPASRSEGDLALAAAGPAMQFDVIDLLGQPSKTLSALRSIP
jgi:hypothetical protein